MNNKNMEGSRFVSSDSAGMSVKMKKGANLLINAATPATDIAKKHGKKLHEVVTAMNVGTEHEMEHTIHRDVAAAIASHHLMERFDYYYILDKAMKGS